MIKGATVVTGGAQFHPNEEMQGLFFQPTILTDVTTDMDISREEIFGPVVAIQKFGGDAKQDVENEIIALSNDTQAGLAAYLFSKGMWTFNEFGVLYDGTHYKWRSFISNGVA